MGQCLTIRSNKTHPSSNFSTQLQRDTNHAIDEQLRNDAEIERKVVKVLLLGTGECGKSTILKQMRILHSDGFKKPEEKAAYKALIWKNILESLHTLCNACAVLKIPFDNAGNKHRANVLLKISVNDSPIEYKQEILALWQDTGLQRALSRQSEFHLLESCEYYLASADRILEALYEPTSQDILHSRISTTGIVSTEFLVDNRTSFRMYDVGGQRGERKKWIHIFEEVTAIMYIASLSEYDQVLSEDRTRNRLKESLDLFEGLINLPWFKNTPIILFLNKDDIFRKKIEAVDIGIYFPQYTGGNSYDAGLKFIQDEYFERNQNPEKTIYSHVTDATNTENIAFVWKAVKHIIMEQNNKSGPLYMV